MSYKSSPLAASVRGIGKTYRIKSSEDRPITLTEAVVGRLRHPLSVIGKHEFAALSDISFDLAKGEALGVIGRNGAGKSTLLKILSRVTEPTDGTIDLYGSVGSLLEVGTGFHPELTGRENIFLNGAILGMSKRAIRAQFDSIVEFAEIGQFLDTPVKRYSSGMYVRLAFAVAAHLDPDILVVDEVLAVGDVQFQRKCLGKMGEVTAQQGRAVLFVSHNMVAVESICNRCIVLESGRIVFDGEPQAAIQRYLATAKTGVQHDVGVFELTADSAGMPEDPSVVGTPRNGEQILRRIEVQTEDGEATDTIAMGEGLRLVIHVDDLSLSRMVTVRISTEEGVMVAGVHNQLRPLEIYESNDMVEQVVVEFTDLPLLPGHYWIELAVSEGVNGRVIVESVERAARFEVLPTNLFGSGWRVQRGPRFGLMLVNPSWEMRRNGTLMAASEKVED